MKIAITADTMMKNTMNNRIVDTSCSSGIFFFDAGLITSSVNVELDVSTSDDSVDMDADNTSTITTAITIDGSVDNIVGMIVSNNGFPVISLITTRSAYNRPKPPRK